MNLYAELWDEKRKSWRPIWLTVEKDDAEIETGHVLRLQIDGDIGIRLQPDQAALLLAAIVRALRGGVVPECG